MNKINLMAAAFTFASQVALADSYTPSHYCSKPYKPFEFNSQWEVDNFFSEVESYKNCIEEFVEEQQNAIRKHQTASEEAIDEWNSFVRWELN